eukprot:TRINITY_DN5932_c0_g1_i1.p1 TRINITY_DN5932_c0_g1~~TRINITY_DN5932_c0_g1_i1.p1  ORF type:complete len:180 (-),score=40.58 TRINITY_DN5932_c0_g1_i1:92-631(-)
MVLPVKLLAIFPAIAFGLGTWQMYRLQWKEDMIKQRKGRAFLAPIQMNSDNIPLSEEEKNEMDFRRVKIEGSFDHSKELIIGPRFHDGKLGYHLITPFNLADEKANRILVNRGWVPQKADLNQFHKPTECELEGIIRRLQKKKVLNIQKPPFSFYQLPLFFSQAILYQIMTLQRTYGIG